MEAQVGKPVLMALFDLDNQGTAAVTVQSVSLPYAHGMAMTEAWLLPIGSGPQLGVGSPYPPVTFPLWADRVSASGAVIRPGQHLSLVFGVLRTTAADGRSDGPKIVYTDGHTTYVLHEKVSLAVSRTKCTLLLSRSLPWLICASWFAAQTGDIGGVLSQLTITRSLAGESHLLAICRTSLARGDSRLHRADRPVVRLVRRSAAFFRPFARIRTSPQPRR